MSGLPREYFEIKKRVEQDKRHLEQVRQELEALGSSLKKEYIREILKPPAESSSAPGDAARWNKMCRRCFKSCKQPVAVKIHHCAKYEPLE
ncbi:MAG: hypothetical protein JRK26_06550 [Deltaproteobacteria bacterium]|nr:hypothetical protein [Deltaproteobacteria bacterium]